MKLRMVQSAVRLSALALAAALGPSLPACSEDEGTAPTVGSEGGQAHASGGSPPAMGGVSAPGGNGGSSTLPSGGGVASGGQSTAAPAVRFVGRVDQSDPAGPRFAWSGAGVVARFSGTSVGVKLSGGQEFTVVLDGMERPKIAPGSGTTEIANGLSAGEHTIELYRRTEASLGESQFLGFELGGGQLLSAPAPANRRLEVVGDSITCGYGNEGANMDCPFTPGTENHYLSYAAIAARKLGAELHTVAWSGKGLICNYGDDANSCTDPLPAYYDRSLPARAESRFDFSQFQPDVVVVNLGTNDFSTDSDPEPADFEAAYLAFLARLRALHADAFLLLTIGPMLSGAELANVRQYITNVVRSRNDAGDHKVKSFEFEPQLASDGYGCDWHPSRATHEKMALTLETVLKSTLDW